MKTLSWGEEPVLILTVDTDWAPKECVLDLLDLLSGSNVKATFFCTSELDAETLAGHDTGVHPNFQGPSQDEQAVSREISNCLTRFPAAQGLRSHALLTSTRHCLILRDRFPDIRYTSNYYMPDVPGLQPFISQAEIPEFPIYWMDHLHLERYGRIDTQQILKETKKPGLKVFDFHPYHIYINSSDLEHAALGRGYYHNASELIRFRKEGPGVRTFFQSLLNAVDHYSLPTITCGELAGSDWRRNGKNAAQRPS